MKYLLSLLLSTFLITKISAQVFIQESHPFKNKAYAFHELGLGTIYNNLNLAIEGILDTKVYDTEGELLFHKQSKNQKFISGKTEISEYHYTDATILMDKLDKSNLNGLDVEFSLVHPVQTSSVICQRKFNTTIYNPETAAPIYIIANGIKITSRDKQVQTQGTELEYKLNVNPRAKRAFDIDNCTIDTKASTLYYMTDNGGYNYIAMNDHEKANRMEYLLEKARNGTFHSQPVGRGFLYEKIGFRRDGDDLVFMVHAVGLPSMATSIFTEGRLALVEHTEEIVEEVVEVELREGALMKLNGKSVVLKQGGRGADGNGGFTILEIDTPLKIKEIRVAGEEVEKSRGSEGFKVRKGDNSNKVKAKVLYYKPVMHSLFFKNEFNLNMDYDIQTKNNNNVNQHLLSIEVSRENPRIKAEIALLAEGQLYNSSQSEVTVTDMDGRPVKLGKAYLEDNYISDKPPNLIIENVPKKGVSNLLAKVKLAKIMTTDEVEQITLQIGKDKKAERMMLDGYELDFTNSAGGKGINYYPSVVTNKPNHHVSNGLMGREILGVKIFSEDGTKLQAEANSMFSLPNDGKSYTVIFETKGRKIAYEEFEIPIGIGYCINYMHSRRTAGHQNSNTKAHMGNTEGQKKSTAPKKWTKQTSVFSNGASLSGKESNDVPLNRPEQFAYLTVCADAGSAVEIMNCSNEKWKAYIYNHAEYKLNASPNPSNNGIYKFIMDTNGQISGFQTIRSAGPPRDKAAQSIISGMKNMKWTGAMDKGKKVSQEFTLPIKW